MAKEAGTCLFSVGGSEYDVIRVVGGGSMGRVYMAEQRRSKNKCAIKQMMIQNQTQSLSKQQINEIRLLNELCHPRIVSLWDTFIENDMFYIVMDWAEGGDLKHKMAEQRTTFPEPQVWKFLLQIAEGLEYLHSHGVLHRDIKLENILLDAKGDVLIADLGLGRVLDESFQARTYVGTPLYLSPEVIMEQPYDGKSDVWALGCLLYELVTMKPPFVAVNQLALFNKIIHERIPALPSNVSTDLQTLILQMLSKEAPSRPSVAQILQSPAMLLHKQRLHLLEKEASLKAHFQHVEDDLVRRNADLQFQLYKAQDRIAELELDLDRRPKRSPLSFQRLFESDTGLFFWRRAGESSSFGSSIYWNNAAFCDLKASSSQILILFKIEDSCEVEPRIDSTVLVFDQDDAEAAAGPAPSDPIRVPVDGEARYYICDASFRKPSQRLQLHFLHPQYVVELRCLQFDRRLLDMIATLPKDGRLHRLPTSPACISSPHPHLPATPSSTKRTLFPPRSPSCLSPCNPSTSLEDVKSLVHRALIMKSPSKMLK